MELCWTVAVQCRVTEYRLRSGGCPRVEDPTLVSRLGENLGRVRLLSRIEMEARVYANADSTTRDFRMGCVLGLLEAGVVLDYWSRERARDVSEAVRNGLPAWRLRRMLSRL
jgi:hypothetical protein